MAEQKQLSASDLERAYEILGLLGAPGSTLLALGGRFAPEALLYHADIMDQRLDMPPGILDRMVSLNMIEAHPVISGFPVLNGELPLNYECGISPIGRMCLVDRGLFDRLNDLADRYQQERLQREKDHAAAQVEARRAFLSDLNRALVDAARTHPKED